MSNLPQFKQRHKHFARFACNFRGKTMMTELTLKKPRILPPKGLLIALGSQLPLVLGGFPLRPSTLEISVGAALLATGVLLNVWADRLFRRNDVGVCPFTHVFVLVDGGPYRITRNPMYLGL